MKKWTVPLAEFTKEHQEQWNKLDGAQGDGDLGNTLFLAAMALDEVSDSCGTMKEWFALGGKSVRRAAPSTMGILISSALTAAGKLLENEQKKNPESAQDWLNIQRSMIEAIQSRGKAKLGDKTILDAFIPAVQVFGDAVEAGKSLKEALGDAASAAEQEANRTADMVSKTGRSSWLGERSKGNVDGGAVVCYQVYRFLSDSAYEGI